VVEERAIEVGGHEPASGRGSMRAAHHPASIGIPAATDIRLSAATLGVIGGGLLSTPILARRGVSGERLFARGPWSSLSPPDTSR
jgi:Na+/glutamate symporter